MVVTRIVPMPCARVVGVVYAMIGLVIGLIASVAALAGAFRSDSVLGPLGGGLIGVGAIVFLPLLYGGIAFLAALLVSWLYNLAAGYVGGLELDVK
jgi:hypothetical protein